MQNPTATTYVVSCAPGTGAYELSFFPVAIGSGPVATTSSPTASARSTLTRSMGPISTSSPSSALSAASPTPTGGVPQVAGKPSWAVGGCAIALVLAAL